MKMIKEYLLKEITGMIAMKIKLSRLPQTLLKKGNITSCRHSLKRKLYKINQ